MMKTMFNLTTSADDLDRFASQSELLSLMDGFDGVELMCLEEDARHIIPPNRVIGLHMGYFPCWLDFWNGDTAALKREFDDRQTWERCYGGADRRALIGRFRRDLYNAHRYGAEYVVFHVSDATVRESFTEVYRHTDEEVIDAACALINAVFAAEDGGLALLVENLWQPGLTLTRPDMTARLLAGIAYPNKGIMLDTGHLMHTNPALKTQKEALAYLHAMLDAHGALCNYIRGVHLNQSLTGAYRARIRKDPPPLGRTYAERCGQMFTHAFAVDRHLPFTCQGVGGLIRRIAPAYLTFEFITADCAQHRAYLDEQTRALASEGLIRPQAAPSYSSRSISR